jgi:two-component SAPR family response regulator
MPLKLNLMDETFERAGSANELQLLGVPKYANGRSLPSRMGHKQLLLFTRLLLEKRPLTRESMIAFLWPEADEARARGSLRQALYVIREIVGNESLVANRQTVAFRVSPSTDLTRFIQAAYAGQWWEAARLYRGRLLDGVQLKDASDADLWLELERRRVARLFEAAALAVLREPSAVHDPQDRLAVARRLRDTAPRSLLHWRHLLDELSRLSAHDALRIECAAFGARIDTEQIDDLEEAAALLRTFVPTGLPNEPSHLNAMT